MRGGTTRLRIVLMAGLILALSVALPPALQAAAQPGYTFDTDPIRLGTKAFEEGRLADAQARFDEAIAAGYQLARARYGQAEVAVRQGRFADGEKLYREALKERSLEKATADYPEAHAGLGLLLLRSGKNDEAGIEFDRALSGKPRLWEAIYGKARLAISAQQWDEARRLLDQGKNLKDATDRADLYHYGSALYELAQGTLAKAETEGLLALALNPADPEYGTLLGEIYRKKGVPALAIDAYERALATPGVTPSPPMLHELGHLYVQAKRYNDARDAYLKALAADSTYGPALHDLARLYRMARQNDRATLVYQKAIQTDPQDVEALVGLSETALESRQNALALDAATKAMALDSLRFEVRLAWARAGLESRDSAVRNRAAALFGSLPDSLKARPEDQLQVAAARTEAREYAAADSLLRIVLVARPDLAEAWFQKGLLEMKTDRNDSAAVHFREAVRLEPGSALYPLNLAIALLRSRRAGEAIPVLRSALKLNSDLTSGRLLLAQALAGADSLTAARAEYEAVVKADPKNGAAWRGLGYCHIRKANYREAVRAYRSATQVDPGDADSWAGLGNANLGVGDLDAAEAAFKRARAIDPQNATLKKGMELLNNARNASGSPG